MLHELPDRQRSNQPADPPDSDVARARRWFANTPSADALVGAQLEHLLTGMPEDQRALAAVGMRTAALVDVYRRECATREAVA